MVAQSTPGKLITISSGAYNSGRKGAAHYCASKAGVVMFTKVLAMELGPHQINVNCVNIVGNTATLSGLVTHSNKKSMIGQEGVFRIVDNGR